MKKTALLSFAEEIVRSGGFEKIALPKKAIVAAGGLAAIVPLAAGVFETVKRTNYDFKEKIKGWSESTVGDLKKRLKPGDVLVDYHKNEYKPKNAFVKASAALQGGKHYHAAIYIGDGEVAEYQGAKNPKIGIVEKGVIKRKLDTVKKFKNGFVVRPDVPEKDRAAAVKYVKDRVGDTKFSKFFAKAFLRSALWPFSDNEAADNGDQIMCSSLIQKAYDGITFNDKKSKRSVFPVDILASDKTKVVAAF